MSVKFLSIADLSALIGIPVRTIRSLQYEGKIPYISAGHRTKLYDMDKVVAALERLEVKAVA